MSEVKQYVVSGKKTKLKERDKETGAVVNGGTEVGYGEPIYLTDEDASRMSAVVCLPSEFESPKGTVSAAGYQALLDEVAGLRAEVAGLQSKKPTAKLRDMQAEIDKVTAERDSLAAELGKLKKPADK